MNHNFQLLPAIDLMDGCVVRLQRGDRAQKTIYSDDPVAFALQWEAAGGDWLHLVDLDAAFTGISKNLEIVAEITKAIQIPCELGGGMRSKEAVQAALNAGVSRVILGTKAAQSMDFIGEMAALAGSEKIAVGIDAKDGKVATHGWQQTTELDAVRFALEVEGAGAGCIIYTDIATDGMLQGPNLPALIHLAEKVRIPVIASGGVSSKADLKALADANCLHGAIIGKALYEGKILPPLKDFQE